MLKIPIKVHCRAQRHQLSICVSKVRGLLKKWFMVGSQVEEYKNVGQSGFVDEIQASEPKRLATEVVLFTFSVQQVFAEHQQHSSVCYNSWL